MYDYINISRFKSNATACYAALPRVCAFTCRCRRKESEIERKKKTISSREKTKKYSFFSLFLELSAFLQSCISYLFVSFCVRRGFIVIFIARDLIEGCCGLYAGNAIESRGNDSHLQ